MQISPMDVLGFYEDWIFFRIDGKLIKISSKLRKEDLVLKLKIDPEDVKAMQDEILFTAKERELTDSQFDEFEDELSEE